jgi:hypothetical protein
MWPIFCLQIALLIQARCALGQDMSETRIPILLGKSNVVLKNALSVFRERSAESAIAVQVV